MNILIVEDDYLQFEFMARDLSAQFPGVTIESVDTESEFRRRIPTIRANPPNLVIMDVLLRWANPGEEPVGDPAKGDFYSAGIRCQELLASFEETKHIPVIFYSMLDRTEAISEA
jgi:DNA-binding NarL/FixJ family response regulator